MIQGNRRITGWNTPVEDFCFRKRLILAIVEILFPRRTDYGTVLSGLIFSIISYSKNQINSKRLRFYIPSVTSLSAWNCGSFLSFSISSIPQSHAAGVPIHLRVLKICWIVSLFPIIPRRYIDKNTLIYNIIKQ